MKKLERIKQWIIDRNLHTQDPRTQMCKVMEELGELAKAINKRDVGAQKDGIGDVVVTLVCLSMQLGLDFEECVAIAYNEIKDRRGKLIDGVFIKEADLPKCTTCAEYGPDDYDRCENCEIQGCPDCIDWKHDREGVTLCPECYQALQDEWKKDTNNGADVCGTCAHFTDEDTEGYGWCELHEQNQHENDYCSDRLPE